MPKSSSAIQLPILPTDEDYEDYLSAYLQAGGLYVERKIIHREEEELLELDILTTSFTRSSADNLLVEIKSGDWGFSDIFKIRGWLTFLNFEKGCLIVQRGRPSISYFKDKAKELDIEIVDNSDLTRTKETINHFLHKIPENADIEAIRFSYLLERKLLKQLKTLKKQNYKEKGQLTSYSNLDDYFFKINSGSFFSRDPIRRINQLFEYYIKFKNITARICNELDGGTFNDDVMELSSQCYKKTFYNPENSILQVSLYVEHIARITILKCVIEHLIDKLKGTYDNSDFPAILEYMSLPRTIESGLNRIVKDKYFYRYPCFWQFFTYVFGGFILTDLKDKEYAILSDRTGIPVDEIPNAFNSFNELFPRKGGWFVKFPNSAIEWHNFFPIMFSGIGANYRRIVHTEDHTFQSLSLQLSKNMTMADLSKWNNLAYYTMK